MEEKSIEQITAKIDANRSLIHEIVSSDECPTLKKILITNLSRSNERLIEKLNQKQ